MKRTEIPIRMSKDFPKEAQFRSDRLLRKGGYIKQISTGRFAILPLGMRVKKKIMKIIEEEMEAINSRRMELPLMQPIEVWQITNRDKAWGKEMNVVEDHFGRQFVLSATAEALMTELFKDIKPTYRDLPINVFQFSTKFRDELRPRGGLLRAREFLMKDAYNFEADAEAFDKTYKDYYEAYLKIFKRMDLNAIPVQADNGALGGDYSHEFMVETPEYEIEDEHGKKKLVTAGGDKIVSCSHCDYKANIEKAEFEVDAVNANEELKPMEVIEQPEWVSTMDDNIKHYKKSPKHFLKNVVYKTDDGKLVIAVLRGDMEANPTKISRLLDVGDLEMATVEDLKRIDSKPGWVHSWGHDEGRDDVIYVVDYSVVNGRNFIGGFKTATTDTINVNYGRDFKHKYEGDISLAKAGYKCKFCKEGILKETRVIEVGHIFKYDDYYSKPHKATFIDRDGKEKVMQMGAYGIGVERSMAVIAELHSGENAIYWPKEVAPFRFHIIVLGKEGSTFEFGKEVYKKLAGEFGDEVLIDDRDYISPGVKFAEADLIGAWVKIIISDRNLKENKIEVRVGKEKKLTLGKEKFTVDLLTTF